MSMSSTAHFLDTFANVQRNVHESSKEHGFWDPANGPDNVSVPTKLCLIHSEVSEALEAYRKGNPPSEKCPEHSQIAEELADLFIRGMDLAEHLRIDLGRAILAKAEYNRGRPHLHGGKKC